MGKVVKACGLWNFRGPISLPIFRRVCQTLLNFAVLIKYSIMGHSLGFSLLAVLQGLGALLQKLLGFLNLQFSLRKACF